MYGFGARGPAMANAQVAAASDGSAVYYNPALLATFDEIRMDVGYQVALPYLALNGIDNDVDSSHGASFARAGEPCNPGSRPRR